MGKVPLFILSACGRIHLNYLSVKQKLIPGIRTKAFSNEGFYYTKIKKREVNGERN